MIIIKKCLTFALSGFLIFSPLTTSYANENLLETEKPDIQKENDICNSAKILTKNGFYLSEGPESTDPVTLDLLLNQNLNIALKNGLTFILDDGKTPFIDNKKDLNQCILKDNLLCKYIKKTISIIENTELSENDLQFQILRRLNTINKYIKSNKTIPETNSFFKFTSAMEHAYKTIISRKIANAILSENREKVEKTMDSQRSSSEMNVSGSTNVNGVIVGISAGAATSETSSETSFYTIDSSAKIGVTVGVGLKKYLSLSAEENMEFTHSLILYSLEQFLDSSLKDGKISTLKLREPDVNKISNSRKQMQENEKKLISLMHDSIEWYLKASEIVPQNVNLKWPDITITKSADKQNSVNSSVSAGIAASCLASIGMEVSTGVQESTTHAYNKYLELLEKNCSPSVYGGDSQTISTFLKQDKIKKYQEIKNSITEYMSTHPDLSDDQKNEMVSILISNLTGEIKMYTTALSILANENISEKEKAEAKKSKKETEKEWIGSSKISRVGKGRLEILKTSIALAAYFSEISTQEKNKPLLCKLYNEIEHLVKIQAFSKNKSKQKAEYSTQRKCYSTDVTGKAHFKIPVVGTNSLSISYIENVGDASFDTEKNIKVQVQIPMTGDKILGSHSIRENFKKILENLSNVKSNPFAEDLKEPLSLLDSNFENILKELGVNIPISVPGYFSVSKYMLLNLYFTKIDKTEKNCVPLPLPGEELPTIADNDKWVLKLIERIDTSSPHLDLSAGGIAEFELSNQTGKVSPKIGNNTLTFLTNKFNALNTGVKENNFTEKISENIPWQNLKKTQAKELFDLFINISKKTNAHYELQCIWNEIANNTVGNEKAYKSACKDFEDFLVSCKNLDEDKSQENFDIASELFDKILELNYEFNYKPEFMRVHSILNNKS